MSRMLRQHRNARIVSTFVLLILALVALALLFLPEEDSQLLAAIWSILAVIGNVACLQTVRIRLRQRAAVLDTRRPLSERRRLGLLSIANANVRRELVRGSEFVLFLILGVAILAGWSTPLIGRAVIVLMQILLLGNVIYDLLELAYTDQFFDLSEEAT